MTFALFTPLFSKVDQATSNFVNDISANAIATATPVIVVGLTLSFIVMGVLIMIGTLQTPISEFLKRSILIGVVCAIALGGGLYQTQLAGAITTLPDDLSKSLITSPTDDTTAATLIDVAAGKGFDKAGEAFDKAGFLVENGFQYATYGLIILIATAILVSIGGAFLLLAKVALALLVGLGPLFIIALLWRPTARFTELWIAQVVNYILLVVLIASIFGLMMSLFSSFMSNMHFDGKQNVAYNIGGAVILSTAMIILLLQLPHIAASLAGGVGIGFYHEARQAAGMGRGAYRGGKAIINNAATRAAARNIMAAGGGVNWGNKSGGKSVAGLYKGKKAA